MKNKKSVWISFLVIWLFTFLVNGCGVSTLESEITGQFVDDPVQGMNYSCSSGTDGATGSDGEYTCKDGDTVTFSIGTVVIGSTLVQNSMITPCTLFPNDPSAAINLARLLQTLDVETVDGVIILNDELVKKLPADVNFSSDTFESDVEDSLETKLVSKEEARKNLYESIAKEGGTVPTVVADAGSDKNITEGTSVTLDASKSFDPNGKIVSYEWKEGEVVLSQAIKFSKDDFSLGIHTIILTVTDNDGANATDSVSVTVNTEPEPINELPIANAGSDKNVTEGTEVILDASKSFDLNGEIVSYEWKEGEDVLSQVIKFSKDDFSLGIHTITLTVTDNNGSSATDSVSVTVNEIAKYSIGGSSSGLQGTIVLQNNGGDNLNISNNGTFAFPTKIADGEAYSVTILTQPSEQTCSLSNASGSVSGEDITNISVSCTTNRYNIGGSVSGLDGILVLQNNHDDNLSISNDGTFTFPTKLTDGDSYNINIVTQPNKQTCIINNSNGIVDKTDITNINISCVINRYSIGGSVSDLNGTILLQNNYGDDLIVSANGNFEFNTKLASDESYEVKVKIDPDTQTCTVTDGSGIVSDSDVTNINVECKSIMSVAQLGLLSDANVSIYQLEKDGNRTLLFHDITSNGNMDEAGQFNAHISELSDDIIYLYEISGGNDIDADDDGVVDDNATPNKGTIHLVARGQDIKREKYIRVTMVSDIIYRKLSCRLREKPYEITDEEFDNSVRKVIGTDINGDHVVSIDDMFHFNPIVNADNLTSAYKRKQREIVSSIHNDNRFYYSGGTNYISSLVDVYPEHITFSANGKIAYVMEYSKLKIIDINNTEHMSILATLEMSDEDEGSKSTGLAVSADGSRLYAVSDTGGLQVVNVSNPSTPVIDDNNSVGLEAPSCVAISHDGNNLYAVNKSTTDPELSVIDLTTSVLSSSSIVGSVNLDDAGEWCANLALTRDDTRLFAATNTLYDINISDIEHPEILASKSYGSGELTKIVLTIGEDIAYISKANIVDIIDISDADSGTIETLATLRESTYAWWKIALHENRLYLANEMNGLFIYDVTHPSHPAPIDPSMSDGLGDGDMELVPDGSILFAGNFRAYDVSDVDDNLIFGRYVQEGSAHITLSKDNSKTYSTVYDKFSVLDTTVDIDIKKLSEVTLDDALFGTIVLDENETRSFVPSGSEGVAIYDISDNNSSSSGVGTESYGASDSDEPTLVSQLDTDGESTALALNAEQTRAYVADGFNGFIIVNITDEDNLTVIASLKLDGYAQDIVLSKDEKSIFIAGFEEGVQIIDISDETAPRLVTTYNGDSKLNYVKSLKLSEDGKKLFVGGKGEDDASGFSILNVTDPSVPSTIVDLSMDEYIEDIVLSSNEDRAYVASNGKDGNMKVIDISDMNNVHIVGYFIHSSEGEEESEMNSGTGIALSNDGKKVYLSVGMSGIIVINVCE